MQTSRRGRVFNKMTAALVAAIMVISIIPTTLMAATNYTVNFNGASWLFDEIDVTASIEGMDITEAPVQIDEFTTISLQNFDPETMEAWLYGNDNFQLRLNVSDEGTTTLGSFDGDAGLPNEGILRFDIQTRNNENPGNEPGNESLEINFGENYWAIGDETVVVLLNSEAVTGPVIVNSNDQIFLDGFNPDTMEVVIVASDGFTTRLNVNEGLTTLNDRDAEHLPDCEMSLVVRAKNGQGPNPEIPPQGDSGSVRFQFDNHDGSGMVYVAFDYDGDSDVIEVDPNGKENFENIDIAIPEGASTVTVWVVPNETEEGVDPIIYDQGASRLYVGDENILSDEITEALLSSDGYTMDLPSASEDSDNGVVFVVSFRRQGLTWYTVSWGGGNVQVENGQVIVDSIIVGNEEYFNGMSYDEMSAAEGRYPIEVLFENGFEQMLEEFGVALPMDPKDVEYENGMIMNLTDLFIRWDFDQNVIINFRMIPDKNYQLFDISTNEGESILEGFEPGEMVATYVFEVRPNSNVHFNVDFISSDDVVACCAQGIADTTMTVPDNVDYMGNLFLEINEGDPESVSSESMELIDGNEYAVLDINLAEEVSMGTNRDYWSTPLHELGGDITIGLTPEELDASVEYYVIREHEGEDGLEVEVIDVTVDEESGVISFDTDRFSTYILVAKNEEPTVDPDDAIAGFAERLYTCALNRESEPAGKAYWISVLISGEVTGADAARIFLLGSEITGSNISDEEFILRIYRTLMGREPAELEVGYWLEVMTNGGYSREIIVDSFINTLEWANICCLAGIKSGSSVEPTVDRPANQLVIDFASRLYTTCLAREGEEAGIKYWSTELANDRASGTGAAYLFFFGEEFVGGGHSDEEFVARLYRTLMNREASEAEIGYWVTVVASQGRESTFYGFAACDEFAGLCASAGIRV